MLFHEAVSASDFHSYFAYLAALIREAVSLRVFIVFREAIILITQVY